MDTSNYNKLSLIDSFSNKIRKKFQLCALCMNRATKTERLLGVFQTYATNIVSEKKKFFNRFSNLISLMACQFKLSTY